MKTTVLNMRKDKSLAAGAAPDLAVAVPGVVRCVLGTESGGRAPDPARCLPELRERLLSDEGR